MKTRTITQMRLVEATSATEKEDILYVPRNKDGSVNRQTNKGKRYMKLKERGAVN